MCQFQLRRPRSVGRSGWFKTVLRKAKCRPCLPYTAFASQQNLGIGIADTLRIVFDVWICGGKVPYSQRSVSRTRYNECSVWCHCQPINTRTVTAQDI